MYRQRSANLLDVDSCLSEQVGEENPIMCNEAPRSTMYIVSLVCEAMLFTVAFVGTYLLQKSVLWARV